MTNKPTPDNVWLFDTLKDHALKLVAKVNDFRFGPQGCIFYRLKTTDPFKEYCGGYNLKWIGPGNPPGKEGKI